MNHHFRILQQRIQAVAIHANKRCHDTAGVDGGKSLEGAFHKIV